MRKLPVTLAALPALALPAMAGSRQECAVVKNTSDGFVNIRQSPNGKIVSQVYPGQTFFVDTYAGGNVEENTTRAKWSMTDGGFIMTKYVTIVPDSRCGRYGSARGDERR